MCKKTVKIRLHVVKMLTKKLQKMKKMTIFSAHFYNMWHIFHQKNNILKKFLHMGDLEKNDKIFRKKSRHVFCKQIYQIHHCKYENDHPHHCKSLPIFISFTTDNFVDSKFVWCMIYHLNLSNLIFFINDYISRL